MGTLRKPNAGQFQKGNPGGGRPLGSRNRLSEVAIALLGRDFSEHGEEVIKQVRTEEPATYLKIVASLLPRQVMIEKTSPFSDLTDEELDMLMEHLASTRAKLVKKLERLEQHNGAAVAVLEPADVEPIASDPTE
jgi:hypothetical protein